MAKKDTELVVHCDMCVCVEMQKQSTETVRTGRTKKKMRKRRYKCPVCNFEKAIYADGYRDLELEPELACIEAGNSPIPASVLTETEEAFDEQPELE